MCVLMAAWRARADSWLALVANRDEEYARPFTAPATVAAGTHAVLAPRDERAGGTWIGISGAGLVIAITNRRDGDFAASRRSRGAVCRDALALPGARAVRDWLETEVEREPLNSFNLFYADRDGAFVSEWNGRLRTTALAPGSLLLSNEHGMGEIEPPDSAWLREGDATALAARLSEFSQRHEPYGASRLRICKHGTLHGTVCSTIVLGGEKAPPRVLWAGGPPRRTQFAEISWRTHRAERGAGA